MLPGGGGGVSAISYEWARPGVICLRGIEGIGADRCGAESGGAFSKGESPERRRSGFAHANEPFKKRNACAKTQSAACFLRQTAAPLE